MILDLKKLSETNYIRKGGTSDYFFDLNKNIIEQYKKNFGENFNIIIHNIESNPLNYYIIPYAVIKYILIDENLNKLSGKNRALRWIGVIKNQQLQIRNCPAYIDVSVYFGNPTIFESEIISKKDFDEIENEYAIENRRAEILVRVKQSKFRKKVLENFNQKCCLTSIKESELIVASHIIPWSKKIETRLDPANGLCLYSSCDKLFDEGYISFTNNLEVIITPKLKRYSSSLQNVLNSLEGKVAVKPTKWNIKNEYLEYHRDIVLIK